MRRHPVGGTGSTEGSDTHCPGRSGSGQEGRQGQALFLQLWGQEGEVQEVQEECGWPGQLAWTVCCC